MIPTAGLSERQMVAAAERRALVKMTRGNIGRLVGWRVRGGKDRARVQLAGGATITVRMVDVIEVEENIPADC